MLVNMLPRSVGGFAGLLRGTTAFVSCDYLFFSSCFFIYRWTYVFFFFSSMDPPHVPFLGFQLID